MLRLSERKELAHFAERENSSSARLPKQELRGIFCRKDTNNF
jgi:hypothetical protein